MKQFLAFCVIAVASTVFAEPPSGYSYSRPSGLGRYSSGGFSSGGFSSGGFSSGGHGSGSGYQQVAIGHSGSEGLHIDQQLLHKIKEVLIQQENINGGGHSGGHSGGFGSGHGGISSSYGPPMQSYGPPGYASARVVGIDFGHVQQGHQVAQYLKQEHQSFGGGYAPSSSYGAPAISRPSSSYGAPF